MPKPDVCPSIPTYTLRPKKKGIPQSKYVLSGPPSSMNTLLDELKRVEALPIWNEISTFGDPLYPSVVADKLSVEEGQYQASYGELHCMRVLTEPALKNRPFEPLSMKLVSYVVPTSDGKTVVNSPIELAGYIVTPEDVLFDRVSMPRMRLPSTEVTPPGGTAGICNITPVLSTRSCETGF